MKSKCMSVGFTLDEAESIMKLDPALLAKILAWAKASLPAVRAMLPFLVVGDWQGAIGALITFLTTLVPPTTPHVQFSSAPATS